ncbi:hypothetical protein DFJ74DRAFT_671544 [Hyaloraphidium curvatum]|nr:hypothetical protein DFJ74DRAFT_671544 [Hyaloraphidium curvatum]
MTGMRSTHVGRDRFVRPDSPLPTKAGKPALPAKQDDDSLQMAMHKRMLARRRRSSIVPPPVVPLTSSSFREFFLWFFFDSLPEQLFRYAEAVARSTAFFFSACAIGRALFCVIGALDKRLTGKELADVSKRTLLVYLCNVISNSPMVLERHSRVAIVNRMMATYLLGELLPATKASAWLGALGAVAATAYTAKGRLGNLAMGIFSAAWSAVEM